MLKAIGKVLAAVSMLFTLQAIAQALAAEPAPTAEQQAFVAKLKALQWQRGPTSVNLDGNATLSVPEGYVFLDAANTKKFLEMNQNFAAGSEVMIAPEDLAWQAYLDFVGEGYVKDDEKIDAAALLKSLKENTDAANAERRKRGWSEMHVVDWATPPAYNRATKRLEWATVLESNGSQGANFFTKVLGRRGHASVQMVSNMDELRTSEAALNEVLTRYTFNKGDAYADFKEGDKIAEYGLAAMVLGGAAAVATKKGFWAVLAGFFAAAWKFIAALAVGAIAWIKSLFQKKE